MVHKAIILYNSGDIAYHFIAKSLVVGNTSREFSSSYRDALTQDFNKYLKQLYPSTSFVREQTEKFIKLASQDTKLADIALCILHG